MAFTPHYHDFFSFDTSFIAAISWSLMLACFLLFLVSFVIPFSLRHSLICSVDSFGYSFGL